VLYNPILTERIIMENYDDYLQDAFENYEDEHRFDEEGLLEELEGEDE
jgi:hypothetical protein